MTEQTLLDRAHEAMQAAPDDPGARLRFYERLATSELFMLLKEPATGGSIAPRLCEVDGQSFVLVFDREDRLARFAGGPAPYAGLSGRAAAAMLATEGLGLGLNLDVAPSAILLPAEAMAWLAEMLAQGPDEIEARPRELTAPAGLPESLLAQLDARLAGAAGLARCAYLAGVTWDNGATGHMLGVIDPLPGAAPALARAVSEVLQFSGLDAAALDVAFFRAEDPVTVRLARVGLRFDLPPAPPQGQAGPGAPGMDPASPPRLK